MEVDISGAKVFLRSRSISAVRENSDQRNAGGKLDCNGTHYRTLHLAYKRFEGAEHLQTPGGGRNDCGRPQTNLSSATWGEKFRYLIPFVSALFATSVVSNLISLIGLRSPTADLSTEAAWAVVVFIMITTQKIKTNGFGGYLKGFTTPIAVMTPFNVLSELATPISMACRHFGNILSGVVINALIYGSLALASGKLLGLLPGVLGRTLSQIPILDVGVPAVLSVYFDWFSGIMQAFIFCMLTVMYIANAAEEG